MTQVDIDKADPKNSSRCVVATAIARSIPGAQRVAVDVQTIRFSIGGERFVYLTPYAVTGYVVAYDAGEEIHPFRFRLRSDQQMKVRQTKATDAGRERERARSKARTAKMRVAQLQERLEGMTDPALPPPPPTEVAAVKAQVKAAKAKATSTAEERDAVLAAYADAKASERDTSLPPAPAMVFKRNERAYGMRQLRINGGRSSGVSGS